MEILCGPLRSRAALNISAVNTYRKVFHSSYRHIYSGLAETKKENVVGCSDRLFVYLSVTYQIQLNIQIYIKIKHI